MSGICCVFSLSDDPSQSKEEIEKVFDALEHKGKDTKKFLSIDNISFFQRMFCVTKEDLLEDLPHSNSEIVICADVRIDNRIDLINIIGLSLEKNYLDSELIAESYKKWGKSFAKHIVGAFAIIIYDKKSKELLCVRDQVGLKPLYFYKDSKFFIISSSIKTIKEKCNKPFPIDIERVREYLFFSAGSQQKTFFKGINSISKGSILIFSNGNIKQENYFKLKPNKKYKNFTEDDFIKEFEIIFKKVIKSQLRSPNNISASALSGGLDSSSVSLVSSSLKKNKNHYAISCLFDGLKGSQKERADESEYIKACHQIINDYKILNLENIGPISTNKKFQALYESPVPAINGYLHDSMFLKASKLSSRIFLDGFDGDSVVSHGQEKIYDYPKKLKIIRLFKEKKIIDESYGRKFSIAHVIKSYLLKPLIPNRIHFFYKSVFKKHNVPFNIFNLVKLESNKNFYRYSYLLNYFGLYPFKHSGSASQAHTKTLENPIWEYSFRMIEALSQNHNIEVRYPFFDIRLMELCISIPPELKFKKGLNRYIFRMAMKNHIPKKILNRKNKADISPFAINEIKNIDLDEMIDEIKGNSRMNSLIETDYLKNYLGPEIEKNNGIAALRIYLIYSLLKWIKRIE